MGEDIENRETDIKSPCGCDCGKDDCDCGCKGQTVQPPDVKPEEPEEPKKSAKTGRDGRKIKELEELIAKMTEKGDELLASLQRERADFDNYRKRNQTAASDAYANGRAAALTEILPVLDNFERATAGADESDNFVKGVVMIERQLRDKLAGMGVTEIEALGQPFDPATMNAVMQAEAEGVEPDTVCEVLTRGYKMDDKILRYAMVKVAK